MNNVVDKLHIPDPELSRFVLILRRLGLGIMGFHDMLIKLGIPYDSDEGRQVMRKVISTMRDTADQRSAELVAEYGSVGQRLRDAGYDVRDDSALFRTANAAKICIAPTGSTSMIHSVSSGIEPYFSLVYRREFVNHAEADYTYVNKHLRRLLDERGLGDGAVDQLLMHGVDAVLPDVSQVLHTAHDIEPVDHIRMQAAAQQFVDNSISKTINLPTTATQDDVRDTLLLAHDFGCKGCTVYRDKCRDSQVFKTVSVESVGSVDSTDVVDGVKMCTSGSCDL